MADKILKNNKFFFPTALFLLLLSVIFRFYGVITKTFPFTYDIGRDLIAAREIATLQDLTLIGPTTGFDGLFYGPSWYYILATVYHPLFGNPTFITGFIVLTGILTYISAYFLGNKISGRFFGITWASLLAFSPAVANLSRQIWSPELIPIFWILSFISLYFIFSNIKRKLNFFVLGVLLSLIIDMEIVVGLLYTAGVVIGLLIIDRKLFNIKNSLLLISGFVLVLLPRIVFDLRNNFLLSKSFVNAMKELIFGGGGLEVSSTPFFQKIYILFATWSKTVALENNLLGLVLLVIVLLSTIFLYKRIKKLMKSYLIITLSALLVSFLGILLMGHDIWEHYLVIFPLLFVTWAAIVISAGFDSKKFKNLFALFIVFLVLLNINIPQKISLYTSPVWEGNSASYKNQLNAVEYVFKDAGETPFKYIVYTPAIHDYPYRYLFSWYGESQKNKPDDSNAELLYLILEPEDEESDLRKQWMDVREDDGEVIDEVELSGEITVQTRRLDSE